MSREWLVDLKNYFVGTLIAVGVSMPASAQIGIYIGTPPPPIRYEERGPMPGPGFAWQQGYWAADRGHYRWVRGHWDQPPYPGAYWSHPHYDHYDKGWAYHEGHWDHEDHGDHRDHDDHGDHRDRDDRGPDHH